MLQPVEVHSIVPALIVHAGILMPCHVYVPVLIQPLPALYKSGALFRDALLVHA